MFFGLLIPTRVKADSFQGFQNGASSESCPLASATGPMHDAQCGLVLLARYNAHGPEALGDLRRRNGSAPSVLRPELLARLPERLATPPSDGGLWTGPKVARW